jgi:hypothetical protein
MQVLAKGTVQKGWSTEVTCTGSGNGNGGCGAKLLVEQPDLFITSSSARNEIDHYVTFKCDECGRFTDIKSRSKLLPQREWMIRAGSPRELVLKAAETRTLGQQIPSEVNPGTRWRHKNGCEYYVLFLTNDTSTDPDYPVTVVYIGDNGRRWSRPLSDWHRSMTPMDVGQRGLTT